MTVFLCGESPEDIWCGIYDAWMSRLGHDNVRIEPFGCSRDLFSEYREVATEEWKAKKVTDAIRSKLSEAVYEHVYHAALSRDELRADKIYRFLIYGFAAGPRIAGMLQIPAVYELFRMERYVRNEAHHYVEFVRFSQMEEGILLSRISPENDVLTLVAVHFADRLNGENWIIYDCKRRKAAVHQANRGWLVVRADSAQWRKRLEKETDERYFEELWKTFHSAIAVRERTNPRCQQNMLPLRFRPHMTEFQ